MCNFQASAAASSQLSCPRGSACASALRKSSRPLASSFITALARPCAWSCVSAATSLCVSDRITGSHPVPAASARQAIKLAARSCVQLRCSNAYACVSVGAGGGGVLARVHARGHVSCAGRGSPSCCCVWPLQLSKRACSCPALACLCFGCRLQQC